MGFIWCRVWEPLFLGAPKQAKHDELRRLCLRAGIEKNRDFSRDFRIVQTRSHSKFLKSDAPGVALFALARKLDFHKVSFSFILSARARARASTGRARPRERLAPLAR